MFLMRNCSVFCVSLSAFQAFSDGNNNGLSNAFVVNHIHETYTRLFYYFRGYLAFLYKKLKGGPCRFSNKVETRDDSSLAAAAGFCTRYATSPQELLSNLCAPDLRWGADAKLSNLQGWDRMTKWSIANLNHIQFSADRNPLFCLHEGSTTLYISGLFRVG